jgi:hypothetical protein
MGGSLFDRFSGNLQKLQAVMSELTDAARVHCPDHRLYKVIQEDESRLG